MPALRGDEGEDPRDRLLTVVTVFPPLSAVLFFLGSFFYERDLAKVPVVPAAAGP